MDNVYSTIIALLVMYATDFCATQMPEEDICATQFKNETCLTITSCPYAVKIIKDKNVEHLIKLKNCGYDRNDPKICCPIGELPISYTNTEEIATNRPKPLSTLKPEASSTISSNIKIDSTFPDKTICGNHHRNGIDNRISNGTIAKIGEHPWLARIRSKMDDADVFGCSAALITDRFLLTAAHCVDKNVPNSIRLGEWNTKTETDCYQEICNNKTIDVNISQIIIHPTFNSLRGAGNDIALIKLKEAVTFTDFIQPVCLPTSNYIALQDYSSDSEYVTAGWGLTEFGLPSVVKRQIQLNAAPIEVCRKIYTLKPEVEPNIICAGGSNGKDTCRGDSGGPLIKMVSENYQLNWYIFGITSYGYPKCGSEGIPGLYTRVSAFMEWIRTNVSK